MGFEVPANPNHSLILGLSGQIVFASPAGEVQTNKHKAGHQEAVPQGAALQESREIQRMTKPGSLTRCF